MLESFEPCERVDPAAAFTVSLRWHTNHCGYGLNTPLRHLQSQVAVQAAMHATGQPSPFQLSKHFGRTPFNPRGGETVRNWAVNRWNTYEKCAAGKYPLLRASGEMNSAGRTLLRKVPPNAAGQVRETLDWKLWRLLDPAPLPLEFINAMLQSRSLRLDWPSIYCATAWAPTALASYGAAISRFLEQPATRLETVEWLWLTMRLARQLDQLPLYALCYALWLNASQHVHDDPLLGGRASRGLYEHAERYFGQLRVYPSNVDSVSLAARLLWNASIPFSLVDGDEARLQVFDHCLCGMLLGRLSVDDKRGKGPVLEPLMLSSLTTTTGGAAPRYWMQPWGTRNDEVEVTRFTVSW